MSAYIDFVSRLVDSLKPGQRVNIETWKLSEGQGGPLGAFVSNGFTPADRVLENVVGSSYTHRYEPAITPGQITFCRLYTELPEGVRSYVSPDRRHWFKQRPDGLYQHHQSTLSNEDERKIVCALNNHRWGDALVFPDIEPVYPPVGDIQSMTIELVKGQRCMNCGQRKISGEA